MSETLESKRPPFAFAKRMGVLVGEETEDRIEVIVRDDAGAPALAEMRRFLARPITTTEVGHERFDALLQQSYESGAARTMEMMQGLNDEPDLASAAQALSEPADLLESDDDAPIIRLINALLTEAIKENASDIHLEPFESRLIVRFRVDGVLREVLSPSRAIAPLLASRIKVMAKLDIAEKRLPQDGRVSLRMAGRAVDVRVSTIPSGHGERVVMRLLDKQAGRLDLQHLGMADDDHVGMAEVLQRPHGIILVTGPTGSGKTTTLYAALTRLNERSRNIMTVEDPIEYYLDGIGQTQVNTKVDMSFARGLRAILRQDPDVVMIGEIRDVETAQIAVQASLTGHLVLSTLHTNNAIGAIPRLRDMGIQPFLLASSLIGLLAQRLVRVLCTKCREPYTADARACQLLDVAADAPPTLYRAAGCNACRQSGFRGRTGIYELITLNDQLRGLIHAQADEQQLLREARNHSTSMHTDGQRKVLEGVTPLEEMLRVIQSV